MKCQILFSWKNKKNINLSSAESAHSMVLSEDTQEMPVTKHRLPESPKEGEMRNGRMKILQCKCLQFMW